MPEADSGREHDDDQQAAAEEPEPQAGGDPIDQKQLAADVEARSKAASAELARVMAREHTDRELLDARIGMTNAHLYSASRKANEALKELAKKRLDGVPMQSLEPLRLIADASQYQAQFLRDEVEVYRRDLADLLARELNDASVEAARQAANAARTTACATIWLAVATFVLIAATIVAAIIATSGGAA